LSQHRTIQRTTLQSSGAALISSPSRVGLEICVDNAAGLLAAFENGADRVELCAALSEGGLTPSKGMMELAATMPRPVRVMIRPRAGNFIYGAAELDIMRRDIELVAACALEGVVLGCNDESGDLDESALAALVSHAHALGLKVTLHRSFDLVSEPVRALNIAAAMRIDTILTSGQQSAAISGLDLIAELVRAARGADGRSSIRIMAGSGVTPATVAPLVGRAGVNFIHASCSRLRGNANESGDRLGLYTPAQRQTDATLVAQLRRALDTFVGGKTHEPAWS
jgi:copper homeostasis protein